jgi:hypothetical protein
MPGIRKKPAILRPRMYNPLCLRKSGAGSWEVAMGFVVRYLCAAIVLIIGILGLWSASAFAQDGASAPALPKPAAGMKGQPQKKKGRRTFERTTSSTPSSDNAPRAARSQHRFPTLTAGVSYPDHRDVNVSRCRAASPMNNAGGVYGGPNLLPEPAMSETAFRA